LDKIFHVSFGPNFRAPLFVGDLKPPGQILDKGKTLGYSGPHVEIRFTGGVSMFNRIREIPELGVPSKYRELGGIGRRLNLPPQVQPNNLGGVNKFF